MKMPLLLAAAFLVFAGLLAARQILGWGKWTNAATLPHLHKAQALWSDGKAILVFGHYETYAQSLQGKTLEQLEQPGPGIDAILAAQEAIIMRGEGEPWHWQKTYSGKGEVEAVSSFGAVLYALGRTYFPDGASKGFLLKSTDTGRTWLPLPYSPMLGQGPVGLKFHSETAGYIWSRSQIDQSLDGGASWNQIIVSPQGAIGPVDVEGSGTLWVAHHGKLLRRDSHGMRSERPLPPNFHPSLLSAREGRVWILGETPAKERSEANLFVGENGGDWKLIAKFPHFVSDALHVGPNLLVIKGADFPRGSAGNPSPLLMISRDGGRHWEKDRSRAPGLGAVYFEGDDSLLADAQFDRLKRRKL